MAQPLSEQQAQQQLDLWDAWIKEGQGKSVRLACRKLNQKTIPRRLLVQYCQIARRVGAPELILRWLRPYVRAEKTKINPASDQERGLYALGLLRLGAFREAEQLLDQCKPEADPQVYFYKASLYINQWNYSFAIPELRKYIRDTRVDHYSKLVGQLNLCASLIGARSFRRAEVEISHLMKKLERENLPLLKGNLLEIRSQLFFEQKHYVEALADLQKAYGLLKKADARSQIYVEKWQSIINLNQQSLMHGTTHPFRKIIQKAMQIGDWETVRECDLAWAIFSKNESLLLRVYWGSAFSSYKTRVLLLFGQQVQVGNTYVWRLGKSVESPPYDLIALAPGKLMKKLFYALTRDLYRPLRITELIDSIYSEEFYNPISSPGKLHRLIARARNWLSNSKLPFSIESVGNAFRLEDIQDCGLLLKSQLNIESPVDELPKDFQDKEFTAHQWALHFQVSDRTARRQLIRYLASHQIKTVGHGPSRRYRAANLS